MTETVVFISPIQTSFVRQSEVSVQMKLTSVVDTVLNLVGKIKVMLKLISEFELEEL